MTKDETLKEIERLKAIVRAANLQFNNGSRLFAAEMFRRLQRLIRTLSSK